jgi:hypothetical protein
VSFYKKTEPLVVATDARREAENFVNNGNPKEGYRLGVVETPSAVHRRARSQAGAP